MRRLRLIIRCLTAVGLAARLSAAPPSVEALFKSPDFQEPQLSPGGTHLVALAPVNDFMNLIAIDLESKQVKVLTGEPRDINNFYFVNDTRIFYTLNSGVVNQETMKYGGAVSAVNLDGSDLEVIIRPMRDRVGNTQAIGSYNSIGGSIWVLHDYPQDEEYVLVANNQRRTNYPDLLLMHVDTGRMKRLKNNPGYLSDYWISPEGDIVGGSGLDPMRDDQLVYFRYDAETDEWHEIADFKLFEADWEIEAIDRGGKRALISTRNDGDRRTLHWMSLVTGEVEEEPVVADPVYDVGGSVLGAGGSVQRGFKSQAIVGFTYEAAKPTTVYFHNQYAKLQEIIDGALPNSVNRIVSSDREGKKAIIEAISDVKPLEYYLLHLDGLGMELLSKIHPQLADVPLHPTKPIEYEASDGRTIRGYLTLPRDYQRGDRIPLILHPHGGPWARDTWGLRWHADMIRPFLASRGFGVLQMDFRGSVGYGKDHYESSFKRPDLMHQDVIDGARWAIDQGYADPDRLGIMGASWGGYATMMALTKEPDMFQFGVNVFGVVDVPKQMQRYRKMYGSENMAYDVWVERMGDPEIPEELAMLKEWSAINHIDAIQAPIFIYHGIYDFNVNIEQSDILVSALKRKGWKEDEDFVVVKRTDEMHGMANEENRIDLYERIDAFLKPFAPAWNE